MDPREQIDLLDRTLQRTASIIAGIPAGSAGAPTPCVTYDVDQLLQHVVSWAEVFASGSSGVKFEGDPEQTAVGPDAAAQFGTAAAGIVDGWRTHGLDREVPSFAGGMMPGPMIFGMTLMEYLAHGWDLAAATGQDPGFEPAAAEAALATARTVLLPEYRTPDYFGPEVPVDEDAPALDRFLGFMGRDPGWTPPS